VSPRTALGKAHSNTVLIGPAFDAVAGKSSRENLQPSSGNRLREAAAERHAAVPVPERLVTDVEVTGARNAEASARADLERIVGEIHKTHGALEQVGGSVAREQLRDAIEAFDLAERHEREIEAEYDAWLLLLQQMKEADAAQATNLGQNACARYRRPIRGANPETL
jgi:transposase